MKNKQLRILMLNNGITQKMLSEHLGICHYAMSKKMRCITSFTWDEIVKISEILGIENPIGVIETKT